MTISQLISYSTAKAFPLKSGIRQGSPHLSLIINIVPEVQPIGIKQEIKDIQTEREKLNCYYLKMT